MASDEQHEDVLEQVPEDLTTQAASLDPAARAEELGDRWGKGPDDSSERSAAFGPNYAGDNQEPHDS